MNKAYHEDGTPKNVICVVHTYPETFQTVYYVHFVKLPKVKYFDRYTWSLTYIKGDSNVKNDMFASLLPKREASMPRSKISFSSLPKDFQKFIMRFYEDTFGTSEDSEKS